MTEISINDLDRMTPEFIEDNLTELAWQAAKKHNPSLVDILNYEGPCNPCRIPDNVVIQLIRDAIIKGRTP